MSNCDLKAIPNKKEVAAKIGKLIDALVGSLLSVPFVNKIHKFIRKEYDKGVVKVETQFDMNFPVSKREIDFLQDYVNNVLQNNVDSIRADLTRITDQAIMDGSSVQELKDRIRAEFDGRKYMNRLKTVIRTEGNRAGNKGSWDTAKKAPFKIKKWLDVVEDARTSAICNAEHDKYGTPEEAIDLEEEFIVEVDNKEYINQHPPFHPNCRTSLRLIEVEE